MAFPLFIAAYLLAHFLFYVLWLRHLGALKREGGIFAFHAVSYALLVGTAFLRALIRPVDDGLARVVLAGGLHGIYSLSFLELWALTHRSYSLAILDKIAQAGGMAHGTQLTRLQPIGAIKRTLRADSLRRLGLVEAGPAMRPTLAGRICAAFCSAILWLSNGRPVN